MVESRDDYRSPALIPYLYYADATPVLDFLVDAFGFEVRSAYRDDRGAVLTAQLQLGDALVMIGPGMAEFGSRGVDDPEWCTMRTYVYIDDVEAHHERARAAGARIHAAPAVHFGGDKIYVAGDAGGHQWIFAERLDPDETSE